MDGMDAFQVNTQPSDAILSIKSPLRYKLQTNPCAMRWNFTGPLVRPSGELRVSARTQSQGIAGILTGFYQLWIQLETHYIGSRFPGKIHARCRKAVLPPVFPEGRSAAKELAQGPSPLHPHV